MFGLQEDYQWPTNMNLQFGGSNPAALGASAMPGTNLFNSNRASIIPKVGGDSPSSWSTGLGANMGTAQLALGGLNTLGNLWGAFQAQNLARKQFDFTKETTNANLNNQIKSYNTALNDRIESRAVTQGNITPEQVADYKARNQMSR